VVCLLILLQLDTQGVGYDAALLPVPGGASASASAAHLLQPSPAGSFFDQDLAPIKENHRFSSLSPWISLKSGIVMSAIPLNPMP